MKTYKALSIPMDSGKVESRTFVPTRPSRSDVNLGGPQPQLPSHITCAQSYLIAIITVRYGPTYLARYTYPHW